VIAGFEQSEREESPDTVVVGSQEPVTKILKPRKRQKDEDPEVAQAASGAIGQRAW
jgi:hypothetical protein